MHPGQRRSLYSLFGVVEHSGHLTSGHYTAYVRVCRRHDQLNVNRSMLNPLVTDAFRTAYEQVRQRAQQTSQTAQKPTRTAAQTADASQTSQSHGSEMTERQQQRQQPQLEPQPEPEPEPESEPQLETGRWFHISDTRVTEVTLDKVLKAQAYIPALLRGDCVHCDGCHATSCTTSDTVLLEPCSTRAKTFTIHG